VLNSSQIITANKSTPSVLQVGHTSCPPTNSVKALKGKPHNQTRIDPSLTPLNSYLRSLNDSQTGYINIELGRQEWVCSVKKNPASEIQSVEIPEDCPRKPVADLS